MKERKLNEIEFQTPGEQVEGRLVQARPIRYKDGGVNIDYLVKRPDGVVVSFRGASMLNKLIFPDDVGCVVRITYRGVDGKPVAENMSPKKIFEVQVDEDSKPKATPAPKQVATDGTEITDEDIPF
jgi:hypothetical protein